MKLSHATLLLAAASQTPFAFARADIEEAAADMDTIVVTATREERNKNELAESVSSANAAEIENVSPSHPAELLNRMAGIHINNLGGEGHMTSIRQPITTGGVYLFLEDGVPTRPTGMFNHNGLYEINIPQASRIEVTKGPGSALYGSDSIGGIINAVTKASPEEPELSLNPEIGSNGWFKGLVSAGTPLGDDIGLRLDLNITDNEGYQDDADYSRLSGTLRLDGSLSDSLKFKVIASYTDVDQSGVSGLGEADYLNTPTKNLYKGDIAKREVEALRITTQLDYEPDANTLVSLTPFFRDNNMTLFPSWMITYDPNIYTTAFQSYGMLAKYRRKLPEAGLELIAGVDVDYSPTSYFEERISIESDGEYYVDYAKTGRVNYDYDADQTSVSPYVHAEWTALENLRFSAGLRYDYFTVDYTDNLDTSVPQTQFAGDRFTHFRPDSQEISYDHLSPKAGIVYAFTENHNVYANYRHSFRVPSIGQLFRAGSNNDTTGLKPVKTDSFEIGFRGKLSDLLNYDVTLYHMTIRDDIVTYIDNASLTRKVTNAGETTHKGIEISLAGQFTKQLGYSIAWTFTEQKYDTFTALYGFPTTEINYAGYEVGKAPDNMGTATLRYEPGFLAGAIVELEWQHMGSYFTDETNTREYGGHDLLNLRASYKVTDSIQVYGRVMNLTDERYATLASSQVGSTSIDYRPGLPRSAYIGVRANF